MVSQVSGKIIEKMKKILSLVFAILLISITNIGITNSYFTDQETSVGNVMTAGCWAPPSKPTLVSPSNGYLANLGSEWLVNPHMDWNDSWACPGKTITYIYESYHDAGLSSLAYRSVPLTNSQIPAPETPDGTYYWRVQAFDGTTYSDWSDVWLLTVNRTPPAPTSARVVINEVYYQGGSDVEWVELYNGGNASADLANWTISDNNSTDTLTTPSVVLPPDSFAVIVGTNNSGQVIASGAIKIILSNTSIGNGLANGGDRLILRDNGSNLIDQMNYGDDIVVWNPARAGVLSGHSLARSPKGFDTNQPSDFVDLNSPNPGTNPHSGLETNLNFYSMPDGHKVGFKVSGSGVSSFDKADYTITYDSDQGIQAISGSVNIAGQSEIEVNNLVLGTCSSGGTCVSHSGVSTVNLEIILSGPITRTLTAELNF
jgi:hypothetical protein